MSCLLCNSAYHLSHNCDIYDSDESRQEILVTKNWCPNCFSHVSEIHAKKWDRCRSKGNKKCYLCFSREHHTVFCPERYTVPNMIVPAIDKDLHKRFFKLFNNVIEQYFLAFLSQEMFDRINAMAMEREFLYTDLKVTQRELKLYDSMRNENDARVIQNCTDRSFTVITNDVILNDVNMNSFAVKNILRQLYYVAFFAAKKIVLIDSKITEAAFCRLLSNYTKVLECRNLKLTPSMKFINVIKHVSNNEELILEETNIYTDEFWADNLLRYKSTKNFSKLEMEINGYKFNVQSLATFIKAKCIKNPYLKLNITNPKEDKEERGHKKELLGKLSDSFESEKRGLPFLSFNVVEMDESTEEKNLRMFASFTKII